ncbi:MAG: MerR family transcriptional regulator [Acidimicrobiaceae bacterium]|nr:MerR family transcriptional regulator [Acidimicrobiaceae bacterium]MXZ98069.1 MerR family transcriptional regulator [Acidimicrobiaceae bacterium]MYE74984.1 MerR family transcriptional regulator [Acidimicrobiaceae bacterium]MYE96344.1 MerR family transcriptional regulator [Acidimicrobiaceae bacterium]MYH43615.1 MerR family transcriptional regulator [Acidimicrobiaceae bacterium]
MDSTEHTVQGYSAKLAADVVGITYRQLDYWARTDLVVPSVARAAGSGSRRLYSYANLLELKVIKRLLDSGIKLEKVRSIFEYMRSELREDVSRANLVIDGSNVVCARSEAEFVDVLQRGQGVLNVLPLSNVKQEVDVAIIELRPSADDADDETADEVDEATDEFRTAIGGS